jgi:hypothetical protein
VKSEGPSKPNKRPDMSSFFAQLEVIKTSNPHAQPMPIDTAAASRLLGDQFRFLQTNSSDASHSEFLDNLIGSIEEGDDEPSGVPQTYLDELERVPKKQLKQGETCPICNEKFLDDQYPLVVVLPCHKTHKFDLECVSPWLLMKGTCPLDRKEMIKKKEKPKTVDSEDEDDDEMGMYS